MLKYYIILIIRNILKIFWIFPVDEKKIYFQSFHGEYLSCNPLYIFKYMNENYSDYKFVCCTKNPPIEKYNNTVFVKKKSLKWIKEILTSKILVHNTGVIAYLPFRTKQYHIETWHGGGAYKRVDNNDNKKTSKYSWTFYKDRLSFVSSSKKFSEIMIKTCGLDDNNFLPLGMARNDIFFNDEAIKKTNAEMRKKYNLKLDDFVVLYAPTFRGDWNKSAYFDCQLKTSVLKEMILNLYNKKCIVLFRGHNNTKNRYEESDFDLDVTDYSDMQELLCTADMLITDYSSSIWDYSFLYRPCFLFTPDFEQYKKERGFYTEPETWGFPICKTNEELVKAIENFNQYGFVNAMKKHHDDLGSYENGHATENVAKLIMVKLNK